MATATATATAITARLAPGAKGGMRKRAARSAAFLLLLAGAAAAPGIQKGPSRAPRRPAPPPKSTLPKALQPDVLNLDACPACVLPTKGTQGGSTVNLGIWADSRDQPGAETIEELEELIANNTGIVLATRRVAVLNPLFVVRFKACKFMNETAGRYCPNGYVDFSSSDCIGQFLGNLTAVSTQGKRKNAVTTEEVWSPASDPTAPFTVVLISRPPDYPQGEGANCASSLPFNTYFTTSRDYGDVTESIVWKSREISLYAETGYALRLLYGSDIPCSAPKKWRMEVLTRAATGTTYTYYRYQEGDQPFAAELEGMPVTLGPDSLIFGYDKRGYELGKLGQPANGENLNGDIAVLSMYNRQLAADQVEALAQAYSCRFNFVTERCPPVEGYTVAANVEHTGDDLSTGCKSFRNRKREVVISEEGAALCDADPDCVGFNTWVQGRKAWACPKSKLEPVVAMPPEKAYCMYTKQVTL